MRVVLMCCVVLCLSWRLAWAELVVCFDASRALGSQFAWRHDDPVRVTDPTCSVIPKTKPDTVTPAQIALIQSTIRGVPAPRYLKVEAGLAVAMTTAEMDAVDAYLAGLAATRQALATELADTTVCGNADFADIEAKLDALQANLASDVAALTTNTAAAIRQEQQAVLTRLVNTLRKIVRCQWALKRSLGR